MKIWKAGLFESPRDSRTEVTAAKSTLEVKAGRAKYLPAPSLTKLDTATCTRPVTGLPDTKS